jgi:hypothetical protein
VLEKGPEPLNGTGFNGENLGTSWNVTFTNNGGSKADGGSFNSSDGTVSG